MRGGIAPSFAKATEGNLYCFVGESGIARQTVAPGGGFGSRHWAYHMVRLSYGCLFRSTFGIRLECAPGAGQFEVSDLTGVLGFRKMKAMARQQRSHSIEFKRQVVQEYIAGETLYGLAKRHDLSRQLIRVWVEKYEAGGLDADAQAADLLHEYETKIVALERMVGRQALEIEFLKGALKNAPRPRSATTSVIAGPTASPSQKDAG